MIIEYRTYTFRPGTVDDWLRHYEVEGLPIQKRHLGKSIGLYVSEIGRLHRIGPDLGLRQPCRAGEAAGRHERGSCPAGIHPVRLESRRDSGAGRDGDDSGAVLASGCLRSCPVWLRMTK